VRSIAIRDLFRASCAVVLALLLPWLALGQGKPHDQPNNANGKAAVRGTITDQTQAVVIGATVVLSNASGLKKETKSDEKGAYAFLDLEAGTYTISVTAANFALKALDYITIMNYDVRDN